MLNNNLKKTIVFYDGFCPMCHFWVRYLLKNDIEKSLHFAPIQGKFGEEFIDKNKLEKIDSLIYYNPNTGIHIYSKAVYEVLRFLNLRNIYFFTLKILPFYISTLIYKIVARIRYKIFKPYDSCEIPSQEILSRIIQ
tara:strand:- start:2406 stop:2816 length:411 start_codon:yes stop_codon:yes gene_type:complete